MNTTWWSASAVLLACSGCAVLGASFDATTRDSDSKYGNCPLTKVGALADLGLAGIGILAAVQAGQEDPPDNASIALFSGLAVGGVVSAVSGFAGWTCQDGYLFGRGRDPDPAPPPPPAPVEDDPLARDRRDCARDLTASCVRLFSATDSPVVRIDAGTRACTADPSTALCDDVATLVQPTDVARAQELLRKGCLASNPTAAAEACAPLGWIDAHQSNAVSSDQGALRQRCLAREDAACAELGHRVASPTPR